MLSCVGGRYSSWVSFVSGFLFLICFGAQTAHAGEAKSKAWPSAVNAVYQITFNGFNIGTFKFEARVLGDRYVLDGDANITALLGVINWRGLTRSVGRIDASAPQPDTYAFNFRSHSKGGVIKIGFKKSTVHDVSMLPNRPPRADEVPLQRSHLKNVLDPLSTVMAMARPRGSDPCAQTLNVFDGRQRFDLALSYRRKERLGAGQAVARGRGVIVCGVKYQPIGGYRPTAATRSMAQSNDMEVAFLPIRSASLFIPQKITIPTMAGTAVLRVVKINIDALGRADRVALSR